MYIRTNLNQNLYKSSQTKRTVFATLTVFDSIEQTSRIDKID